MPFSFSLQLVLVWETSDVMHGHEGCLWIQRRLKEGDFKDAYNIIWEGMSVLVYRESVGVRVQNLLFVFFCTMVYSERAECERDPSLGGLGERFGGLGERLGLGDMPGKSSLSTILARTMANAEQIFQLRLSTMYFIPALRTVCAVGKWPPKTRRSSRVSIVGWMAAPWYFKKTHSVRTAMNTPVGA